MHGIKRIVRVSQLQSLSDRALGGDANLILWLSILHFKLIEEQERSDNLEQRLLALEQCVQGSSTKS
jgi:hypothetical protein